MHLEKTTHLHLRQLWDIVQDYPDYFDEPIKTFDAFVKRCEEMDDSLVITSGREVVGCISLVNMDNGIATVNIMTKRHSLKPSETPGLLKSALRIFFVRHGLKMIGAFFSVDNIATWRLVSKVGGLVTDYIEKTDQLYASVLREAVVHEI